MRSCKYRTGVTLVEMLTVVAIIAILASVVIGMATYIDNQSKGKSLENTFALLESALEEYREYARDFPEQTEQIPANAAAHSETLYDALNSQPSSRKILENISGSLIADKGGTSGMLEIYDPWGTVLDYRYNGISDNSPELISAGPDRTFGNGDDISSKQM
jgi:prepilin-type N-terminal cleavage/methylation domain-containing protein